MNEISLREGEEYIKLGQLLKKCGVVGSGTDAKFLIEDEQVKVNGEVEVRRGRKIRQGDVVTINEESFKVKI